MNIKKTLLYFLATISFVAETRADEGMWMLPLIRELNLGDMKKEGCKLSADDIYSINASSLKDAVVIFGGGCTGEIISPQGLLLTNHHCGYGSIQQHSSVEHDYLKNGFTAKDRADELPTPGLNVRFLERIEEVTHLILPAVNNLPETQRAQTVDRLSDSITKQAVGDISYLRAQVAAMFGGNRYFLMVYRLYSDVRMVFAPPSAIGKFGADTDNWMWPRHTGDFALFRVYTDPTGNPAEYAPENIPMKPRRHLAVSLKGYSENDFAMVLGFPGTTHRYMTSWEVNERMSTSNAIRIQVRGIRQKLMMEDMRADPNVRIKYAVKYSSSSNYWKNSIGMNKALKRLDVVKQKQTREREFIDWTSKDARRKEAYGEALALVESSVTANRQITTASVYLSETLLRGSELIGFAANFSPLYGLLKKNTATEAEIKTETDKLRKSVDKFFKNYNRPTDRKISAAMYKLYFDGVEKEWRVIVFDSINDKYAGDFERYADELFAGTFILDREKLDVFLDNPSLDALDADPAIRLERSVNERRNALSKAGESNTLRFNEGHRRYVAGLTEMYRGKRPVYPDANFTMRMTYGKISGYRPADASRFDYVTTVAGILEKEDRDNPEFEVPDKLKRLVETRDFGDYAMNDGRLPVCFIFNGDITGGNSGSPVLNANGELIGTAFDGNWEAMSGDIAFETEMQRCISVDIRYTLFVIEKFARAKYLVDEMTIVK